MTIPSTKKVSLDDLDTFGKTRKSVSSSHGNIELRVTRAGQPEEVLKTQWLNFYIDSWRSVIEAFFGEDTGANRVPAVSLTATLALEQKSYEIKSPFDGDWEVAAIYGEGRPNGGIGGDAFGNGLLKVQSVTFNDGKQHIKASFKFSYLDRDGYVVKVESDEFWAENDGV
ncbi:hypothetical protein [Pseudomonas sp. L13]|uniref:hypothetical protein n=1 Tax=Pseudomonas sp. L13 TaxID=343985 RepID=UPI00137AE09B|nr:hypothetical protein [Pseudomonas sp. L13]NCE91671.1 hypothetical protein [Pseudomonas sp. L13]